MESLATVGIIWWNGNVAHCLIVGVLRRSARGLLDEELPSVTAGVVKRITFYSL